MGVRTTHAWRLGGFNPACHSGWLLYDNTKGLSIGGVCFFAIALQEHWNRLIARVFSNGADTSPQHKQTNKQLRIYCFDLERNAAIHYLYNSKRQLNSLFLPFTFVLMSRPE